MITHLRTPYNASYDEAVYQRMLNWITEEAGIAPAFHVAETPVFIPAYVKERLLQAGADVIEVVTRPGFREFAQAAIPPGQAVPGQTKHPLFLQMDFGMCLDDAGKIIPQLVEAQGFPSLYFFQDLLAEAYRTFFDIPESFSSRFGGLSVEDYQELLGRTILHGEQAEHVILLEVEPQKQATRIDFIVAVKRLGIAEVCISDIKKEGRKLYYYRDGVKTQVKRIFNRVIFDELLKRDDLELAYHLTEEVEVAWAGHPDWFAMLSKHTMPLFDSPYVPKSYFLDQAPVEELDLREYVLKPLYSFAGQGVNLYPTLADLEAIEDPKNYILQRKVAYAPLVETLDEPARAEVRLMYLWPPEDEQPTLINNLVRLSKGEMVGVRYNKGKTWVGGSIGYFE